jgi:mannose-6-phosphate isomerase-like protein (cupin superfamily)
MMTSHFVPKDAGEAFDLGMITMRVLVDGQSEGAFGLVEFRGGEGPWTVPHRHDHTSESFFVLDGTFDFICADQHFTAGPGDYILIPVGSTHMIFAHGGGGTLLAIFAPAGLQEMFKTLSRLPPGSLQDPATRREISKNYDSVPV